MSFSSVPVAWEYELIVHSLGRNQEFLQLNVDFTTEVVKAGYLLTVVPPFLREYVVHSSECMIMF